MSYNWNFAMGVVIGWTSMLFIHLSDKFIHPPSILWSDFGSNVSISYFKNSNECESVRAKNKGALDSVCLPADTVTDKNPLYIEMK